MIHTIPVEFDDTTVEFDDTTNTLQCGFRVNWLSGTRGKGKKLEEVDLACGAGVGSPWLIFTKKANGKTVHLVTDIRKLMPLLDEAADKLLKK